MANRFSDWPTVGGPLPERMSKAEGVVRHISEIIMNKQVEPGDRLGTKEELRQRFEVSVGTFNEVVRLLETRGLVEARPGPRGGIFVSSPSAHIRLSHLILGLGDDALSVANSLEVREALEVTIAEHAAREAGEEQIGRLREIVALMADLRDDPAGYLARNWELHEEIARISPNRLLCTLYVSLLDTARESVREIAPDPGFAAGFEANLQLHRDLVDAIASGDARLARRAAEAHTPPRSSAPAPRG
ncbi:FCD domain-containing protein [Nocardiopsis sp. NPDC007018]|uniref:FadR/GntR family transcriptional regulator n=1 Tax=Nocardiopsis sp. NPDC007018 TaxID=3155721 RepID=UPI00340795E9